MPLQVRLVVRNLLLLVACGRVSASVNVNVNVNVIYYIEVMVR
jgi:hypothetical protein